MRVQRFDVRGAAAVRPPAGRAGLLARACALAFPLGVATGCYTYAPLPAQTTPGSVVVLDVNDRGRVALGETLGPSVNRIEGSVQSRTDSLYVLNVTAVEYLNGAPNKWSGERVAIRADFVSQARERRLSRGKTALAAAVAVGAVVAFIATRSIFASGTPTGERPDPGNPNGQ